MLSYLGRLQQFSRVIVAIAVELQESEETPYATQDPALASRMNADVVQSCGEMFQIFQLHLTRILALPFQIVEQLPQVMLIGVERITRHITLQLQIPHVPPHHFLVYLFSHLHLRTRSQRIVIVRAKLRNNDEY
jgi:hypothetical protein